VNEEVYEAEMYAVVVHGDKTGRLSDDSGIAVSAFVRNRFGIES
jgi:hypothetical protein